MAFKSWDTAVGAGWDSGLRSALWSHFSLFLLMRRYLYEERTYLSTCHGFKVFETQVHRLWSMKSVYKPKLFYFLTVQSWAKSFSLPLSFSSLKWGWATVFALLGGGWWGGRGEGGCKHEMNQCKKKLPHKKFSCIHFFLYIFIGINISTDMNKQDTDWCLFTVNVGYVVVSVLVS